MRILFVLVFCFFATGPLTAISADQAVFEQSYLQFNQAAKSGDWKTALKASKTAYEEGIKIYGKRHINAAMLNYNYGLSLYKNEKFSKAKPFLKRSLKIYRQQYGEESVKMIPILMDVGRLTLKGPRGQRNVVYFNQALKLVAKHHGKGSVEYGEQLFKIANIIENRFFFDAAFDYYLKAYKVFRKTRGETSVEFALAAYHLGIHQFYFNDISAAIDYFESSVKAMRAHQLNTDYIVTKSHAFLEKCYKIKKKTQKSNYHAQAILEAKRENASQSPVVLYMDTPYIRARSVWKGSDGYVVVRYDISADGYTKNLRIESADAPNRYIDNVKEIIEEARFLPKYEEGIAKPVSNVKQRFYFDIDREARRFSWRFNSFGGQLSVEH